MKSSKIVLMSLLLAVIIPEMLSAKRHDKEFQEACQLLQSQKYLNAYNIFLQLYEGNKDPRSTAKYLFYKAKAAYYAELHPESMRDFESLIAAYPESEYVPYCYLFSGHIHYRYRRTGQAIDAYLNAYAQSTDNDLSNLLVETISIAAVRDKQAADRLSSAALPKIKRCVMLAAVAEQLIAAREFQSVRTLLAPCQSSQARELIRRAERSLERQLEIGIVLPFSGELQRFGESLYDGILLRLEQYVAETGEPVTPVVFDTQGRNMEAARIVRQLSQEGIAAVIGPLTSEEAAVASAVLTCSDMPLIAPAASQAGFTELSSNSFQLQPNLEWQGIRMADFAVQQLGADTAAIITPTSADNLSMARAFAERFEELGGTILAIEYFRIRETDFGPYVRDIKSQILGELLDSIIFLTEEGDTIEAEEVPVWIDCLYIPADAGQLQMLLPQIGFYNLNSVYLGSDSWGNKTVYDFGDNITRTCYFSSGRIDDADSERLQQFSVNFDRRFGRQPSHLEALGYDAMALLCEAFGAGQYTRTGIAGYLAGIKDYRGISGVVSFGANRENIEMPIFTIEDGEPKKVGFQP